MYKRADGRWIGAVTVDGARHTVSAATKARAAALLADLRRELAEGERQGGGKQTLAQFLTGQTHWPPAPDAPPEERELGGWLGTSVKINKAYNTWVNYERALRLHVLPYLGDRSLEKLTPADVQNLLATLHRRGLAPSSIVTVKTVLATALNVALRWELVRRNAATLTESPRVRRPAYPVVPIREVGRYLAALRDSPYYPLYLLCLTTGLREGEALGLLWSDVDLEAGTAAITKQLQRSEAGRILAPVKREKSVRVVRLPAVTARALGELRAERERVQLGRLWEGRSIGDDLGASFVFTGPSGGPLSASPLLADLRRRLRASGISTHVTIRTLRRSYTTALADAGIDPKVLAETLGHTDVKMTLGFYRAVSEEAKARAAGVWDQLLPD